MRGLILSVGLLAAVFALVHPERYLRDFGEHLDPFRTPVVFAQQADAICADYQRSVLDLRQPLAGAKGWQPLQRLTAQLPAVAEREVAKLNALALPTTNRGLAKAWIAAHDRFVVLLRRQRDAAQRKDMRAVMVVDLELDANVLRQDGLALKLGMKTCPYMFRRPPNT